MKKIRVYIGKSSIGFYVFSLFIKNPNQKNKTNKTNFFSFFSFSLFFHLFSFFFYVFFFTFFYKVLSPSISFHHYLYFPHSLSHTLSIKTHIHTLYLFFYSLS